MIDLIQNNTMITIYGKRFYQPVEKRSFEKMLENKLLLPKMKQSSKDIILPFTGALPEYQTIYIQMIGFSDLHEGIKALLVVAL
jgi:hypothetical protein